MKCTRVKTKSKNYPDDDAATTKMIKTKNDKDFCFNSLFRKIRDTRTMVGIKLLKWLEENNNMKNTFILPTYEISTKTIQGIAMFPKLKEFVLFHNMTYQHYMANDCGIKKYHDTSTW